MFEGRTSLGPLSRGSQTGHPGYHRLSLTAIRQVIQEQRHKRRETKNVTDLSKSGDTDQLDLAIMKRNLMSNT